VAQTVTVQDQIPRDSIDKWEPFLASFHPMPGRLVITKPIVQEIQEERTIIIPDTAKRVDKEFGLEARVLLKASNVDEAIQVGDTVIIPEFGGTPIVLGVEVPFWTCGEGDIIAVIKEDKDD